MKSQTVARKTASISEEMLESLLAQRQTRDSLRKRLEMLDAAIESSESEVISLLESGATQPAGYEIEVKVTERRYPSWKSHFAEIAGAEETERVLRETIPTITKSLIVR